MTPEAGGKLHALSRLPAPRIRRQIARYMAGEGEAVYVDISRGAALRQLTHQLSLWEQVPKGGPIVWPILVILAVGILIVIERVVFLLRKNCDAEKLMQRIAALVGERRWPDCRSACLALGGKPVARVLAAGLECCHLPREEMENACRKPSCGRCRPWSASCRPWACWPPSPPSWGFWARSPA